MGAASLLSLAGRDGVLGGGGSGRCELAACLIGGAPGVWVGGVRGTMDKNNYAIDFSWPIRFEFACPGLLAVSPGSFYIKHRGSLLSDSPQTLQGAC